MLLFSRQRDTEGDNGYPRPPGWRKMDLRRIFQSQSIFQQRLGAASTNSLDELRNLGVADLLHDTALRAHGPAGETVIIENGLRHRLQG